jgi:hypothetical protein
MVHSFHFLYQTHIASRQDWSAVLHGDPRIDNWFFNEKNASGDVVNEVGLLDWQLMCKVTHTLG